MLEISFIILSIAFLLLAGSLAAIFFQLWRMLQRLMPTIDELNRSLPGILKNVEDVTTNIKGTSTHVQLQVENLSQMLSRIQACLAVIPIVEGKLREGFGGKARNMTALLKGMTVFVRTFISSGREARS